LMLRLYEPDKGEILIDGHNINIYKRDDFLSNFGFVSQEPFLLDGTVAENIVFGNGTSREEIIEVCKKSYSHNFIEEMENKYDTYVGDAGAKLSVGQKQRVAIARALYKKPEILILDEPTSALDNRSELRIQETLRKLSTSLTIIIIAHRLSTVISADKILVLRDGMIVEEGSHGSLIASKGHYYYIYSKGLEE